MTLEMRYFRGELVQLIVSRSDSELEVQRLLVVFALFTGDRRHSGFHDKYQVMQMHSTDSTLGQWVRQWTSQAVL